MDSDAQLRITFNSIAILIYLSPQPNLLTLEAIIANFRIIEVKVLLKNKLLSLINELNYNVLIGIFDVENDSFIPNRLHPNAYICLSKRLVLVNFHRMGAFLKVLGIDEMHLEF